MNMTFVKSVSSDLLAAKTYVVGAKKNWYPIDTSIRGILNELRDENKETVRSLEAKTGLNRMRIQVILTGETTPPSVGELTQLARAFGVKLAAIIHEAQLRVAERK